MSQYTVMKEITDTMIQLGIPLSPEIEADLEILRKLEENKYKPTIFNGINITELIKESRFAPGAADRLTNYIEIIGDQEFGDGTKIIVTKILSEGRKLSDPKTQIELIQTCMCFSFAVGRLYGRAELTNEQNIPKTNPQLESLPEEQ